MRVLALLEDRAGPSARLRFEPLAGQLEAQGHSFERAEVPRSGPRRWRLLARASGFDAAFLQRRLLQPFESALLRARARRLVVDVDDAIWRRERPPFESWTRRVRALALWRRADSVLAGSRSLVAELRELGIEAQLLPTPVEPIVGVRDGDPARAPRLLWIGQPSTWRYVGPLAASWQQVRAARADARFVVIGSGLAADPGFPGAEFRSWSAEEEVAALREADVGLAPLSDDPWTRGKCGARHLRYLAAGVPTVASPVGAQREIAEEVGGTLLARSAEEFAAAVLELVADRARARRMGAEACGRLVGSRTPAVLAEGLLAHLGRAGATEPRVAGGGGDR